MKIRVIFLLLSLNYINCFSQDPWHVMSTEMENRLLSGTKPSSDIYMNFNVEGSPFLSEEFEEGSLITTDSLMYKDIPMRYNIYTDEMEFLLSSPDAVPMIISEPRKFLYFFLEDKVFIYTSFFQNKKPESGYLEVLNEGNYQVLLRRNTIFIEEELPKGYSDLKPARFVPKHQYYFRSNRQIPEEFSLRRSSILKIFSNKRTDIEQFVKENRLSYRDINDVIRIADYYSQLSDNQPLPD